MYATLKTPHRGYTKIHLIEQVQYKWRVQIVGSGLELEVYEDEFTKD